MTKCSCDLCLSDLSQYWKKLINHWYNMNGEYSGLFQLQRFETPEIPAHLTKRVLTGQKQHFLPLLFISMWMLKLSQENLFYIVSINSLCYSDTIWQHTSESTLAEEMGCCLTAPSHFLNQCWLIIKGGIHQKTISQEMPNISNLDLSLKMTKLKLQSHLPGADV